MFADALRIVSRRAAAPDAFFAVARRDAGAAGTVDRRHDRADPYHRRRRPRPTARTLVDVTLDRVRLRLPIVGSLLRKTILARFARMLATLSTRHRAEPRPRRRWLRSPAAPLYAAALARIVLALRDGEPLHAAARGRTSLRSHLLALVAVGEETGMLDAMLATNRRVFRERRRGNDCNARRRHRAAADRRPRASSSASSSTRSSSTLLLDREHQQMNERKSVVDRFLAHRSAREPRRRHRSARVSLQARGAKISAPLEATAATSSKSLRSA